MAQDNEQPTEINNSRTLSRRRVLQLLAATGGFAALDRLLPDSWVTPTASAGADTDTIAPVVKLPIGCTYNAFPLRVKSTYVHNLGSTGDLTSWQINFSYNDSLAEASGMMGLTAVVNDNGTLQQIYNHTPIANAGGMVPVSNYTFYPICNTTKPVETVGTVGNGFFQFVHNSASLAFYTQAVAATPVVDWFLTDNPERQSNLEQTDLIPGPTAVDLTKMDVESVEDGLKTAAVVGAAALGAAAVLAMRNESEGEKE